MNIQSKIRILVYALCVGGAGVSNLYAQAPNTVIHTIPTHSFFPATLIHAVAISNDGSMAYVLASNNTIFIVNTGDFSVMGTVSDTNGDLQNPTFIAVAPSGNKAYVKNSTGTISILNTLTHAITGNVTGTFVVPYGIAFTADGLTAYVTNQPNGFISIIDVARDTVSGTVSDPLSSLILPRLLATTPLGIVPQSAYVCGGFSGGSRNVIDIVNVASRAVSGSVQGYDSTFVSIDIAITPDGKTGYVINANNNMINIIDLTTNRTTGTVMDSAGIINSPGFIVITPDGTTAYVPNVVSPGSVGMINLATNAATTKVDVGRNPGSIAITPNGQQVWVVNIGDVTVSIIGYAISNLVNLQGCQTRQIVLGQMELVNVLTWQAPTTGAPMRYDIYRDAALTDLAGTVTALEFSDPNRQLGVLYTYYIVAVDSSGNVASATNIITVTQPCNYVISQVVNPRGHQAKNVFLTQTEFVNILTWQPPTTGTPVSYIIYRDALLTDVAGTVLATANPLQFVDHSRKPGATYTYYIIAVDASGNTSAASVIPITQSRSKK